MKILILILGTFLFSQDNAELKEWYVGVSKEGGNSFILGNSNSGWRYAISYNYNKNRDLYEETSDYSINPDKTSSILSYGVDVRKNLSGKYFSIFKKLPGLTKTSEKYRRNLAVGFLSYYRMFKSEFSTSSMSSGHDYIEFYDESINYSFSPYIGYNIEVFFKNNFSITIFSHLSINYQYTEARSEDAYYNESIMVDLMKNLIKRDGLGTSNTGFEWSINYYFDE